MRSDLGNLADTSRSSPRPDNLFIGAEGADFSETPLSRQTAGSARDAPAPDLSRFHANETG
jgi:hypothetical protein